jgi:hypothetical protein
MRISTLQLQHHQSTWMWPRKQNEWRYSIGLITPIAVVPTTISLAPRSPRPHVRKTINGSEALQLTFCCKLQAYKLCVNQVLACIDKRPQKAIAWLRRPQPSPPRGRCADVAFLLLYTVYPPPTHPPHPPPTPQGSLPHLGRGEIPDGSPMASASPLLLLN